MRFVILAGCALFFLAEARAQRGMTDWVTTGADAQRSEWVRTDAKISPEALAKPGFQMLWKVRLDNSPKQWNGLMPAVGLDFYIGYRGFRSLAFVAGSSDNAFALDVDLGRIEWQKHFNAKAPAARPTPACPGGMTAAMTRPAFTAIAPPAASSARAFGRGGAAKSGVGEPFEGAVTLKQAPAQRPTPAARTVNRRAAAFQNAAAAAAMAAFRPRASYVYAISSDGMLHAMYVSNGEEPNPAVPFLPANANVRGLIVVEGVAYAATAGSCEGAPDGIWALDLETKQVNTWKGTVAGTAGPAFGPDGEVYVTTESGELTALEPKTLKVKAVYKADAGFSSSPVIFEYRDKIMVAAASKDGRLHILDADNLSNLIYRSEANTVASPVLASWQDTAGTRWILAPTAAAIGAWKLVERNGAYALERGWQSRDLVSPLPPVVINGVVFATSGGRQKSANAVVYALDGKTGKELWNSGNAVTSFVHSGGLTMGDNQLYLGTYDGTLYAFGFPMEH